MRIYGKNIFEWKTTRIVLLEPSNLFCLLSLVSSGWVVHFDKFAFQTINTFLNFLFLNFCAERNLSWIYTQTTKMLTVSAAKWNQVATLTTAQGGQILLKINEYEKEELKPNQLRGTFRALNSFQKIF